MAQLLGVERGLDQAVDQLDALLRDVRLGVRSAAHFDELESDGEAICTTIRAAFRGARR